MKRLASLLVVALVILMASESFAGWVDPSTVVYAPIVVRTYRPVAPMVQVAPMAPVYTQPVPAVSYYPAPVAVPMPTVVSPTYRYPAPVIVPAPTMIQQRVGPFGGIRSTTTYYGW